MSHLILRHAYTFFQTHASHNNVALDSQFILFIHSKRYLPPIPQHALRQARRRADSRSHTCVATCVISHFCLPHTQRHTPPHTSTNSQQQQQDDLPQIRSMLPKPDELTAVSKAKQKALREHEGRLREHNARQQHNNNNNNLLAGQASAAAGGGGSGASASGVAGEGSDPRGALRCSIDSNATSTSSSSASGIRSGGSGSAAPQPAPQPPRLGVVEATFEALGAVKMLMAKMRACEFR